MRVSITDSPAFECAEIVEEGWNGHVVPAFWKGQAETVAAWVNANMEGVSLMYVAHLDAYTVVYDDEDGEVFETIDGPLYCVGGRAWAWEAVDDCECSESYRHRGEHTPGCPADNGERA